MKRIAVFGYSIMSVTVMTRLRSEHYQLLFVGQNEQEVSLMTALGFTSQAIDFRNDDELKAIGIGSGIDILFCFFTADSDNVFLTISARALAKDLTIIAVIDDSESADKLLAAGADKIINPHEICGRKAHEMLTQGDISMILDNTVFGQHDLNMAQIEIQPGSYLENQLVSSLNINVSHNLILLGVVHKAPGDALHLAIDEQMQPLVVGDMLVVLGSAENIRTFKDEVARVSRCNE
jgi:voltage-gated potassium channel